MNWPVARAWHGDEAHSVIPRAERGGSQRDRHGAAAVRGRASLDLTTALSVIGNRTDSEHLCYRPNLRAEFSRHAISLRNLRGLCWSHCLANIILGTVRFMGTVATIGCFGLGAFQGKHAKPLPSLAVEREALTLVDDKRTPGGLLDSATHLANTQLGKQG